MQCRIFLQVNMLSEVCNAQGNQIFDSCFDHPQQGFCVSKLIWPNQGHPGHKQWTLWRRALQPLMVNEFGRLQSQIGEWFLPISSLDQKWDSHMDLESDQLFSEGSIFVCDKMARVSRQQKFTLSQDHSMADTSTSDKCVPADVRPTIYGSRATAYFTSLLLQSFMTLSWDQFLLVEMT